MNIFLPHAGQLGFSLHVPRFLSSLNLPPSHPGRPHPALLYSIYVWALRLSHCPDSVQLEPRFLARAISALTDALGDFDARTRTHALQAEVLLAQYFFCLGRFLEGRYHANAAVSLALSCDLHAIRAAGGAPAGLASLVGIHGIFDLAAPRDVIEEGERVNAFWAVFNIDRCWSFAVGSPPILCDDAALGTQIDTPWPLEMEDYELVRCARAPPLLRLALQGPLTFSAHQLPDDRAHSSTKTIQSFLDRHVVPSQSSGQSGPALRVKASALFERVARLATRYHPGKPPAHPARAALADRRRPQTRAPRAPPRRRRSRTPSRASCAASRRPRASPHCPPRCAARSS